ncbi:hypothetical protein [Noviherbaspirillum denitrificans]|uniref:Uncharacterized protein n=1 Tax=Noviherbaspirillum denitrificans TaxID=1968433 RepID=A0A254TFB3_9BURK|nr:hypothetical protein [Noviherbaspirillum denitrificans]OWW21349.1 hypothetical protein AYR66_19560 [Noviherbaspirillum denitrificans]
MWLTAVISAMMSVTRLTLSTISCIVCPAAPTNLLHDFGQLLLMAIFAFKDDNSSDCNADVTHFAATV